MSRRQEPPTMAMLVNAWLDVLMAWGIRWSVQILFALGIGIGVGLGVSTWLVSKVVKQVCL